MDLAQLELDVQDLAAGAPAAAAPAKPQPKGGILKKADSPKEVRGVREARYSMVRRLPVFFSILSVTVWCFRYCQLFLVCFSNSYVLST